MEGCNMKETKFFIKSLLFVLFAVIMTCGGTKISAATNEFRGINWADQRDNFNSGVVYVSGLGPYDTYSSASIVADRVIGQFVSKLGTNSVRLPINEATVSEYWSTYTGAIDTALTKGKVILCYWGPRSGVGPADMNKWWNMWSTVTKKYGNNSNCYFEVFNEPNMYTPGDLCNLYAEWLRRFPNIPHERIILDGAFLAQAVVPVGDDPRLSKCLLAVHDYSFFVGNPDSMSEAAWEKHLSDSVGKYANRTICTEWGAPMSPGSKNGISYGYQDYSKSGGSYFVPYVRGITNQLRKWNMGSFYWVGLRDGDWYSMVKKSGSGSNITLTVSNQSGLDRMHYSWGNWMDTTPTTTPIPTDSTPLKDGWYYIKNVNAQKYLQVAENIGKSGQNIEIRTGSGKDGQKWYLKNLDNGYVTLKSALGDYMVDVTAQKNEDGTNIEIYTNNSGVAQQFSLQSSTTKGAYIIATKCSGLTKVLDAAGNKTADGTNVLQWTANGQTNQQWLFEAVSTPSPSTVVPTPVPSVTPSPSMPSDSPVIKKELTLEYSVNDWGSGYQVNFKVANNSGSDINTWTLKLNKSEINIDSSWNVNVKEDGNYYVITPLDWNSKISNGSFAEFGIQGVGNAPTELHYLLS